MATTKTTKAKKSTAASSEKKSATSAPAAASGATVEKTASAKKSAATKKAPDGAIKDFDDLVAGNGYKFTQGAESHTGKLTHTSPSDHVCTVVNAATGDSKDLIFEDWEVTVA